MSDMKPANMTRSAQVCSVGNYLMTGRVLGKGHFARVEEATHRIIGKKVAIKIIDLTLVKEEYARRNLHREPRVMARLRHPCIAALYETMMHGPRLYVVMEAAAGGDLCTHVLNARGTRGLPEVRARCLAAQLVSAVRHMHDKGVVHRDLKMENIMLDGTKQFIKIVDFGLSNFWSASGALRTPCGSLEYAAPELFVDGRRYGPEVDLWSIGVIVYGMVTGGLPFTAPDTGSGEERDRPLLRQIIAKGFGRKQRTGLACVSAECKAFIQHLLEPNVALRMKIEETARHRWIRKPGMRMKLHPFGNGDTRVNRDIYKKISEITGDSIMDIVAQIRADPFGAMAGIFNIKTHHHQLQSLTGTQLLWSQTNDGRSLSPPEHHGNGLCITEKETSKSKSQSPALNINHVATATQTNHSLYPNKNPTNQTSVSVQSKIESLNESTSKYRIEPIKDHSQMRNNNSIKDYTLRDAFSGTTSQSLQNSRYSYVNRQGSYNISGRSIRTANDNGDNHLNPKLPSINEHSNTTTMDVTKHRSIVTKLPTSTAANALVRKIRMVDEPVRLNSCPRCTSKIPEAKRTEFYRRAGDGLPSWRSGEPTRILLQSTSSNIKRASLGSIVSPHSSTNSKCKSERAMPVGWCSKVNKEVPLHRYRRNTPTK